MSVTLDFIDCLRKAQNQLYKEKAMNEVESESVKSQVKQIVTSFNQSRINQKEYFAQIRQILNPTTIGESLCGLVNNKDPNQISPSPLKSQTLKRIVRFASVFQSVDPPKNERAAIAAIDDKKRFYLDLLSYSIIPSYFNFFWTEFSIKNFFKFLTYIRQHENEEFYDSVVRVTFATPFFIRFSTQCFQSVFNELFSVTNFRNIKKKVLVEKIRCNVKKYQQFIPDETLIALICSSDPVRTLINSFFNIAFSSPVAAQTLGLFHFSCKPSKDVLNFLKTVFDLKHRNTYVKSFLDSIIKCGPKTLDGKDTPSRYLQLIDMYSNQFKNVDDFNQEKDEDDELKLYEAKISESVSTSLESINTSATSSSDFVQTRRNTINDPGPIDFTQKQEVSFENIEPIPNKFNLFNASDVFYAQEIFQTKFLDSTDLSLIQLTHGKVSDFVKPEKIEYYTDSKVPKQQKFSQVKTEEATIFNRAILIAPMIRHLLQRADLIPCFKKPPSDVTLNDFLYTFLVKRGSIQYLSEREMNFDQMLSFMPKNSMKETIKEALSSTFFTRMKKIRALSTFASIELKIHRLNERSQQQICNLQIVSDVNKMTNVFKLSKSIISTYIKCPNLLVAEYNSNMQKYYEPEYSGIIYQKKVLFTLLIEKIDLMTFSAQRESFKKLSTSLKEYDAKFSENANRNLLKFVKECFPPKKNKAENEFNKNDYITKKIMRVVGEKKEIIDTMNEAFLEHSLMRKLELFSTALGNFQHFLQVDCPPEKDLGSDEFTPAFAALIMLCNPPMTVTNYVYLHDMTTGEIPVSEIFGGYASTIPIYLRVAIEFVIPELAKNPPFLLQEEDI